MHISTRGFSSIWLGLLLLSACAAEPIRSRPADAGTTPSLDVATDPRAVAMDLPVVTAEVANQACGNGILDRGEECDDGNTTSGDGCSSHCMLQGWGPCTSAACVNRTVCGNGILTSDETCDDGNTVSGDGCSSDCQSIEAGWHCRMIGTPCSPICGDSTLRGSETCDDGNTMDGDGCSVYCLTEPGWNCASGTCVQVSSVDGGIDSGGQQPRCGDGIMSGAEECDRGAMNADTEYGGCTTQCFAGPFCGDGIVNGREECDLSDQNGSIDGPDGCSLGCAKPHYCGDGVLDSDRGEECDLGAWNGLTLDQNLNPTNDPTGIVYCTADCRIPACCVF